MSATIIGPRVDPAAIMLARDRLHRLAARRGRDLRFVVGPSSDSPASIAGYVDRILAELALRRDYALAGQEGGDYRAALAVLRRAIGSRQATGLHIDSSGAVYAMW